MKEGCSQNKWYSDPTDTSIGSRSCGFGVTRVALKRRIDAGRLMARRPLFTAVCHNFGYPICVIGSAGCGVFPLWFVMPCYAHGQVASVVCHAVLCHGRVEESYFRRFPV